MGIEKPVAVGVALKICDEMIATTKDLDKPLSKKPIDLHVLSLKNMTCLISKQMHCLQIRCCAEFFQCQRLLHLTDNNPDRAYSYRKALSMITTHNADWENILH